METMKTRKFSGEEEQTSFCCSFLLVSLSSDFAKSFMKNVRCLQLHWCHPGLWRSTAMGHQHVWLKEAPDGRTSDDKYGDMRDMAHNSFWTSTEELQRLQLLLEEDPEYETSSEWPGIVEWCTSCADTRVVKLVLPEEIQVPEPGEVEESTAANSKVDESASCDAFTQTPRQRPRRRGGRGSRARRMLVFVFHMITLILCICLTFVNKWEHRNVCSVGFTTCLRPVQ